jgi:hypothetical protein
VTVTDAAGQCQRHNGGDAPCLVLAHFPSMPEAQAWARAAAAHERTRFLVRYDAGRTYTADKWEAIQTWLRTM